VLSAARVGPLSVWVSPISASIRSGVRRSAVGSVVHDDHVFRLRQAARQLGHAGR